MYHVLIVEDDRESRRWMTGVVIAAFPGCLTCGAGSVAEALAAEGIFDLALIDLGLPDGSGLEVLRALRERSPGTRCVITTVLGDDGHIVAALAAGSEGYLLKEQGEEALSRQLQQLANGIPVLSPSIARRIMEHFQRTGPSVKSVRNSTLTSRERQALSLISRGLRNVDVAAALGIAESTVASHIKSIYRKLGISTRAEASWHATRLGL